jgi:glutamate synthase (NADPH/NADH) small chain
MGKPTGFIEWQRLVARAGRSRERVHDWREVEGHHDEAELRQQAGRCMDCGVPFCMQGCPLGNPIPDFNDRLWRDQWQAAWRRLDATNNFPEFTGRLCPAPCEAACVLGLDGAPVTIEHIEKELAERAWRSGWITPQPGAARQKTGQADRDRRLGPGGPRVRAAARARRPHRDRLRGRRPRRRPAPLRHPRLQARQGGARSPARAARAPRASSSGCGVRVGVEPTWAALHADHDAVVIAIGAGVPRELAVPGRELAGVMLAMDYLEDANRAVAGLQPHARHDVAGQRVIVLGGGDTGSDCLGTALRQGAASVQQLELMPAPPTARRDDNPWPTWPLTFRTSSSQEEGGERGFALRTTALVGDGGRLTTLRAEKLAPAPGRAAVGPGDLVATGETVELPCDRLILALGFTGPDTAR